jgi:hypothetical protein
MNLADYALLAGLNHITLFASYYCIKRDKSKN